jgi:hypothetical protein
MIYSNFETKTELVIIGTWNDCLGCRHVYIKIPRNLVETICEKKEERNAEWDARLTPMRS